MADKIIKLFQGNNKGDYVAAPPDANDTLVGVVSTQTLTNKTLTTPTLDEPVINRVAQTRLIPAGSLGKIGGTATVGWVPAAAADANVASLAASATADTLVIPVPGLKVGDTITAFHLIGQIESAGGGVTLDAALHKQTAVAADITDASIGAITQISVTADTKVDSTNGKKTLATPEVVAQDEMFYILVTGTTAASTDIVLMGVAIEVTEV